MEGKFKFENVAKTFSEDQETRYQGGMMKDKQTKANLISIQNLNSYLFLITIMGALFQWPIGYLSDRFDRRLVMVISALIGAALCVLCFICMLCMPTTF